MLTTAPIKRSVAVALALVAAGAPSAGAELVAPAPTRAEMIARREALATKAWRAANPPKIVEVTREDDGFDLPSAAIGAAVPLTLILLEAAGRQVLRRRRDSRPEHRLA